MRDERGTIRKEWGGRLPIALVFPNSYHAGMSSLALHLLYGLWNDRADVVCERVFAEGNPPASLESGAPLDHFPIVAFSVSYEMDYVNIVAMLRGAGIPPRAADRDETHPLILAGGPAISANPEPLALIVDAVVVGEVEPIFVSLTEALQRIGEGRAACLDALASIPGLYLPALPTAATGPKRVTRQWLDDLDAWPCRSVVLTPHTEFSSMGLVEIARGCERGCRFCLAGVAYRPARQRSLENIVAQVQEMLPRTDRIGLVSAAVSDHAQIDVLAVELRRLGARLSVSSMRADPASEPLIRALAESGTRTLTIAPEAGSERLRQVIGKTQTEEDVLHAVDLAAHYGLAQLKLYFILGLPTEEQADLDALVKLAAACAARFPRQVTVNLTPFVPKAHTPFQRQEQLPARALKPSLAFVERELTRGGIQVKAESLAWAEVQGTLARGDRRVGEALLTVKHWSPGGWREALGDVGLTVEELLARRPATTPLPWRFIHFGVSH